MRPVYRSLIRLTEGRKEGRFASNGCRYSLGFFAQKLVSRDRRFFGRALHEFTIITVGYQDSILSSGGFPPPEIAGVTAGPSGDVIKLVNIRDRYTLRRYISLLLYTIYQEPLTTIHRKRIHDGGQLHVTARLLRARLKSVARSRKWNFAKRVILFFPMPKYHALQMERYCDVAVQLAGRCRAANWTACES